VPETAAAARDLERICFIAGALFAMLAVAAGAFGAHALAARLTPERLAIFETGVRYQMYHALGLFALGWAAARWPAAALGTPAALMIAGVLVFSGTLYALALGSPRWLGMITPIGGSCLIFAWLLAAWAVARVVT
jgi:uncharacterized membrane protein YgdD (TMEM256/DUF423 family)